MMVVGGSDDNRGVFCCCVLDMRLAPVKNAQRLVKEIFPVKQTQEYNLVIAAMK